MKKENEYDQYISNPDGVERYEPERFPAAENDKAHSLPEQALAEVEETQAVHEWTQEHYTSEESAPAATARRASRGKNITI